MTAAAVLLRADTHAIESDGVSDTARATAGVASVLLEPTGIRGATPPPGG